MHDSTVWQAREINPAKRYLLEYRTLIKRRDALLDELDRLQDANHRATSRLTAVRLGGTGGHEDTRAQYQVYGRVGFRGVQRRGRRNCRPQPD